MNSVYAVNDPDTGNLLGTTVFALNITERKKAEIKLRESERRLRRFNESGRWASFTGTCKARS